VSADAVQSIQPRPQPQPRVAVVEPWTGNAIARQTSTGSLTFVGWADPERRYEVWQDASGKQYVRNIGGNWYRGEDVAKAQAESQRMLQQVNALETQYNPQLNSVVQRYFKEGDKWYTLQYDPQTNSYKKVEGPAEKIQQTIFDKLLGASSLNIQGYNIPNIEKYAVQEPHAFTWYGPEYARSYGKLRETFPELKNEKWITEADVQNVLSQRLEKYGWRPDTREKYEQLRELSFAVLHNPDIWTEVEKDINRQLEEARPKIEELQRFYEAKALKQWDAVQSYEAEKQLNQFYKSATKSTPTWSVGLQGFFNNMARFLSFGFINPAPSGYETLLARYEELANKAPAPGMMLPSQRIKEGMEAGVYTPQEKAEIKAIEQNLDPTKTRLYTLGYGAAFYLSGKVFDIALTKVVPEAVRFAKWEFTSKEALAGKALKNAGIELKTPEFLSNISEAVKTKALNIGEKIGLVERVQYVPTEVNFELARIQKPGSEALVSKVEFTKWTRAEEVLGKTVPESMRLQPGEVSTLPVKLGEKTINVPIVSGEFGVAGGEKIALAKEGVKLKNPFFVYGKGTGEDSFFFAKMAKETGELTAPKYDFIKVIGANIEYQKVLEQAMGGTPKAILYTEEMEKALGFSRAPRIPVMEKHVSNVENFVTPLKLPLYLHPERRPGGIGGIESKIPTMENFEPDINIKPWMGRIPNPMEIQPTISGFRDLTSIAPKLGDIVMPKIEPKIGQVAEPKLDTRVEPRIGDITISIPKIEPKLEPPINIPDYKPPPGEEPSPKLPGLPFPIGSGTRDIPIPGPRLYGRKEWVVQWFGPALSPAKSKSKKSRRGGRRK
jgi:hypothetical protein